MTVAELIEELKKYPQDAVVEVGDEPIALTPGGLWYDNRWKRLVLG